MAYLQRLAAASRSVSLSPSLSRRALTWDTSLAHRRVVLPSELPAAEWRTTGGGPSGAPAHRRVEGPSELHHARVLAPTMELLPMGDGPSGARMSSMAQLQQQQEEGAHAACLTQVLPTPAITTRVLSRQGLNSAAALSKNDIVSPQCPCAMELRPGVGQFCGMPLLALQQQETFHTVRLAEELRAPPTIIASQTRQGLSPMSTLSKNGFVAVFSPPLALTTELHQGDGWPCGMQLLTMEQLEGVQAARLAKGLQSPSTTMGSLTLQKLAPQSKLYCGGANVSMKIWKRGFSSSPAPQSSVPVPPSEPIPPPAPVPPPPGWRYPFFDENPMTRFGLAGCLKPDFAKNLKTIPSIIPQVCVDERTFLPNYEPLEFIKALPLVRKKRIYGLDPDINGVHPCVLLPVDAGLHLMRSLPMLAQFFHTQSCCLTRITLKDLAISADGRFRLRGYDFETCEHNSDNVKDVYASISKVFTEVLALCGGTSEIPGYACLQGQLENFGTDDTSEYLICVNAFFLPLGNKGLALLRLIEFILQLPETSVLRHDLMVDLPYMEKDKKGKREWVKLAWDNEYLRQWMGFRQYGDGGLEFLRFVRN